MNVTLTNKNSANGNTVDALKNACSQIEFTDSANYFYVKVAAANAGKALVKQWAVCDCSFRCELMLLAH